MNGMDATRQVLVAVKKVLAGHTHPEERRRADAFLLTFQKSNDAIVGSLRLLETEKLENHEQLFLINTIYRSLCSRGSKDHVRFQDPKKEMTVGAGQLLVPCFLQLCQHIQAAFSKNESFLLANQYACCVAVSLLATTDGSVLNTLGQLKKEANNGNIMPQCVDMAVIVVLQLLPEEMQNKRLLLRKDHRQQWEMAIQAESSTVLKTLEQCWQSQVNNRSDGLFHFNSKLEDRILQCFGTWVLHGKLSPIAVAQSTLLAATCDIALKMTLQSSSALEVIQTIVEVCIDTTFCPLILSLVQFSIHLGTQALEHILDIPSDLLVQIAITVSDCGEQALVCGLFANEITPPLIAFLDMLLGFTSIHDIEAMSKVLDFWVKFRSLSTTTNSCKELDSKYSPQVLRNVVLSTAFNKTSHPNEDEFQMHRKEMRTIMRLMTQDAAIYQEQFIYELVSVIFHEANTSSSATLYIIEAAFHALSAMAKSIPPTEETFMPQIFTILSSLASSERSFAPRAFLRTATVFISVMQNWIALHPNALPCVHHILSKSFDCIEDDEMCTMRNAEDHIGAVALLKLAVKCPRLLFESKDTNWLGLIEQVYQGNFAVMPILSDKSLNLVIEAFGFIMMLEGSDYYAIAAPFILHFTGIMSNHLAAAMANGEHEDAKNIILLILGHLTTLTLTLRRTSSSHVHPIITFLEAHWHTTFQPFLLSSDGELQAKVCELFSAVFHTLEADAISVASHVASILITAYTSSRASCCIDTIAASMVCITGAPSPELEDILLQALVHFVRGTMELPTNDVSSLRSLLVFVVLCGNQQPNVLIRSNVLGGVLAIAKRELLEGTEAIEAVLPLVSALWLWRALDPSQALQQYVVHVLNSDEVVQLLHQLVRVCIQNGDSSAEAISQVLLNTRAAFTCEELTVLFQTMLSGFPSVSVQTKRDFMTTILHHDDKVATARKIRRYLKQFKL